MSTVSKDQLAGIKQQADAIKASMREAAQETAKATESIHQMATQFNAIVAVSNSLTESASRRLAIEQQVSAIMRQQADSAQRMLAASRAIEASRQPKQGDFTISRDASNQLSSGMLQLESGMNSLAIQRLNTETQIAIVIRQQVQAAQSLLSASRAIQTSRQSLQGNFTISRDPSNQLESGMRQLESRMNSMAIQRLNTETQITVVLREQTIAAQKFLEITDQIVSARRSVSGTVSMPGGALPGGGARLPDYPSVVSGTARPIAAGIAAMGAGATTGGAGATAAAAWAAAVAAAAAAAVAAAVPAGAKVAAAWAAATAAATPPVGAKVAAAWVAAVAAAAAPAVAAAVPAGARVAAAWAAAVAGAMTPAIGAKVAAAWAAATALMGGAGGAAGGGAAGGAAASAAAAIDRLRLIRELLAQMRAELTAQAQILKTASTTAPNTVDKRPATEELSRARQPISALNAEFAALKAQITAAGGDTSAFDAQINKLLTDVQRLATAGFKPAIDAVNNFTRAAAAGRTGLQGYFTAVREGLEKLNEQSLAANLQEISFRLLPVGIAAGAAVKQGVETAQGIEVARVNLTAFTGSQEKAIELMNTLTKGAQQLGQPMFEVLDVITAFAPQLREANIELDTAFDLAARLLPSGPGKRLQDALFSINEAAAGQMVSLRRQFNVPMNILQPLIDEKGLTAALNEYLNSLGRTSLLTIQLGNTSRGAFQRMSDSWSNFLASALQPYIDGMTNAANITSKFFDNLATNGGIIKDIVGLFLTLTSTLTTGLIAIGQFALAFNAIAILVKPLETTFGLGTRVGVFALDMAAAITRHLPPAIISAVAAASPIAAGIFSAAMAKGAALAAAAPRLAAIALPTALAVGGGVALGTAVAGGMGIPGINNQQDAMQRLIQMIALPIGLIIQALNTVGAVIVNGARIVAAAFENIGITLSAIVPLFTDIFAHVGAAITNAIGGIQVAVGNILLAIASWVETHFPSIDTGGLALAGAQSASSGLDAQLRVRDLLETPIKNFQDYMVRELHDLTKMDFMPSEEQQAQIAADATRRLAEWFNALAGVVNFFGATVPLIDIPAPSGTDDGSGTGDGSGGANNADLLEQVYTAALQHMIQTTRMLEDQALQAAREAEDWALQRNRAFDDFNRSTQLAQDDFNRSQAQAQDDYNRQVAEEEASARENQRKQQDDFNKQTQRAAEDHLKSMMRMARDVDDAISARDFLSAQKQIQKMNDEQEDYDIEQKRRQEDFAAQIEELEANLKKQQDKRREDFQRQQRMQADNFALQQRRQAENFARQQQREQEDRDRRLARQQQDYVIAAQRREQDFQLQLIQLQTHNGIMRYYWQYGLRSLESDVIDFFNRLRIVAQGSGSGGQGGGGGGNLFADGIWRVPFDMFARIHKDEMIVPARPFADSVRRGEAIIGGRGGSSGGDIYQISVPLAIYGDASVDAIVDAVENRVIPKLTDAMIKVKQNRRSISA